MPQASDSSRPVTVTVASVVVFLLLRDYHRLFTLLVLNQGVPKGLIYPGFTMIRVATIDEAYSVFVQIPEFGNYYPIEEVKRRLANGHRVLVAQSGQQLVGFKLGYPKTSEEFYSWLGGVLPAYRQGGIAQRLLEHQEAWARRAGFTRIAVKSMNKFPSMLRLLIKNGYQVTQVDRFGDPQKERLHFIKVLDTES